MAEPAPAQSFIVMGVNDHRQCLDGWFARDVDPRNAICFRWTQSEATFRISVPQDSRFLHLMVSGSAPLTGRPESLSLYVGQTILAHLPAATPTDHWTIVDIPLGDLGAALTDGPDSVGHAGKSSAGRVVCFVLRCEERLAVRGLPPRFLPRVFIPDRYLRNGDFRALGIKVAAIRVE